MRRERKGEKKGRRKEGNKKRREGGSERVGRKEKVRMKEFQVKLTSSKRCFQKCPGVFFVFSVLFLFGIRFKACEVSKEAKKYLTIHHLLSIVFS